MGKETVKKMKTTKKTMLFGLLLASTLSLAAVACGSSVPDTTKTSTSDITAEDGPDGPDGPGGRGPEGFVKRFDKDGNGTVELTELPPRMKEHLAKADTNNDGKLSIEELKADHEARKGDMLKHLDKNGDGNIQVTELPPHMQEHMAGADTNKDGILSKEEFKTFQDVKHAEMLAKFDTNKDGKIDRDEGKAMMVAHEKERFAKADKNGDGALTKEEVGEKFWAHLSDADADKNGSVTQKEIDDARASGKLKMGPRGGGPDGHGPGGHGPDGRGPGGPGFGHGPDFGGDFGPPPDFGGDIEAPKGAPVAK